jgi:hypothetical protein
MVCAFVDSTGTSVLDKRSAESVLKWYNNAEDNRGEHPKERLADFPDLLRRCLRGSQNCEALVLTRQQCRDIRQLHREFRNRFTHFRPGGWGIEKVGLPRIVGAALYAVEDLMGREHVARRMSGNKLRRLKKALMMARNSLEVRA